jgi:hypothetical protein
MTEAKWLACDDPWPMLALLRDKASSRKMICFILAFCPDHASLTAVILEEGIDSDSDFRPPWLDVDGPDDDTLPSLTRCWGWAFLLTNPDSAAMDKTRPRAVAAPLLRELIGNPFRPVTLNPSWLTSTVLTLAEGTYAERAFDRLPILADALQDAGCDNTDVLDHCRGPGQHVRGCWVVDLVLGKQ